MDTVTKLEESRARLVQQGSQLFRQTSTAATAFVTKGRKAGSRFATDTRKASEQLVAETKVAGQAFASGLSAEARMWLETLDLDRRLPTIPALPANAEGLRLPSPRALEREVLVRIEHALRDLGDRLDSRVKLLDTLVGPQLPATTTPATPAQKSPTNGARKTSNGSTPAVTGAPISGYDELAAKDIVTRLERMSDDRAAQVLAYESANKKRATVIRAAEQRLAADA